MLLAGLAMAAVLFCCGAAFSLLVLLRPTLALFSGSVVGQRGRAWLVEIRDGNKLKTVISRPQHLRAQQF